MDTQDKYNVTQNAHKNILENNKLYGTSIHTKKLKKREVADNMDFRTTVFQKDSSQQEIITDFYNPHIAISRIEKAFNFRLAVMD